MKKILKKAFGYQSVSYYARAYQYEGKPQNPINLKFIIIFQIDLLL